MSSSYKFPQQLRAQDAITELNYYFEKDGITEKERLPKMSKIVDYCVLHPRLLRVRDSPLKYVHDSTLPTVVVHDWYVGIALDYLEASLYVLFLQWETDFRKKRNDEKQIAQLFSKLVHDIYHCYEDVGLALALPFPEGSALGSAILKEKVKHSSIALIKEKIQHSFNDARNTYITLAFEQIESLYRAKQQEGDNSFAYLFSEKLTKCKGAELEATVQLMIDTNLPQLIDMFNLSDRILDNITVDCPSNDENNTITANIWLQPRAEGDEGEYDVQTLESSIQDFSVICEKLNNLDVSPNWTDNLKEIINRRLSLSKWQNNLEVSLVPIQLKWLHVLILPWISYILSNTEDSEINWNNFLREKIKAEFILYDLIYHLRIGDIFGIIIDYPLTKNAVNDFHITATKRGLLQDLKNKLMEELKSRLLHQGASATDILQQYIGCIRCLSVIDPTCDTMVPIIDLFENYMRAYRDDVIKGVVELVRDYLDEEDANGTDEQYLYVFETSEINKEETPRDTVIVKEDKPAKLSNLQKKVKDRIAMLVSICNSISDFISGYSDKLGEVLLSSTNYDIDSEVRKLELLKQHFPPDVFIRCDIMLKDMDDSRRLDRAIHERSKVDQSIHAIIMSGKYWLGDEDDSDDDDNNNNNIRLQSWMEEKQIETDSYDVEFRKAKANRKLSFLPTKGTVTLNLEFKSRTLQLDVRPEAYRIIDLFETKEDSYSRDDIKKIVQLDMHTVVESLEFWLKQEVLQLTADGHYELVEE